MTISYSMEAVITALFLILGFSLGFWWRKRVFEDKIKDIESYAQKIIKDAQRDVVTLKKEAQLQGQDVIFQMKSDFEKEMNERNVYLIGLL